uniref:Uncharacterized protein n=1 Tax=Poecilia reticulata TaxID=8081 RepID=A0A3P9P962_POERE
KMKEQREVKKCGLLPEGNPLQTVVNIPAELPNNHIIWSLISFVYGNLLCLGLAALIFSIKVSFCVRFKLYLSSVPEAVGSSGSNDSASCRGISITPF